MGMVAINLERKEQGEAGKVFGNGMSQTMHITNQILIGSPVYRVNESLSDDGKLKSKTGKTNITYRIEKYAYIWYNEHLN